MTRHCCFVPPYLLRQIALSRPEEAAWVEQMLAHDDAVRLQRTTVTAAAAAATGPDWVVHTARHGSVLPAT